MRGDGHRRNRRIVFREIRQTTRIPLVISIWRGVAGMGDSLRLAWAAAKPIYESGEPEGALTHSVAAVGLPRPEPLAPTALACIGTHRRPTDRFASIENDSLRAPGRSTGVLGAFGDRLDRHRHRLVRAFEQHQRKSITWS